MWFKANFSFASPNECAVVPLLHIHCFRRGIYFPLRLTQGSLSTSLTPTLKVLRVLPALLHISYSCHRLCVSLRRYFRYFAVTHFLKQSLSLISALRLRILTECLAYFFYCVFGCCYFCVFILCRSYCLPVLRRCYPLSAYRPASVPLLQRSPLSHVRLCISVLSVFLLSTEHNPTFGRILPCYPQNLSVQA